MTRRPSAERRCTAKSCRRPSRRLHADTSGPVSQTISRRFETAPRRHGAKGQGRPRLHQHTEAPPGRARPTPRRAPRKMCASASPRGRAAWPGTRASKWCAGQLSWAEYEGRSMSESTLGLFWGCSPVPRLSATFHSRGWQWSLLRAAGGSPGRSHRRPWNRTLEVGGSTPLGSTFTRPAPRSRAVLPSRSIRPGARVSPNGRGMRRSRRSVVICSHFAMEGRRNPPSRARNLTWVGASRSTLDSGTTITSLASRLRTSGETTSAGRRLAPGSSGI